MPNIAFNDPSVRSYLLTEAGAAAVGSFQDVKAIARNDLTPAALLVEISAMNSHRPPLGHVMSGADGTWLFVGLRPGLRVRARITDPAKVLNDAVLVLVAEAPPP